MEKEKKEAPGWVTCAINASKDFHYGIEGEIIAIWENPTLTGWQKEARIERMMVNARHAKWGDK